MTRFIQALIRLIRSLFGSKPEPITETPLLEPDTPELDEEPTETDLIEPPEEPLMVLPFDTDKKRIIKAILSVIETGTTWANYGSVTVLNDGAGITYGAHQSTDGGESSLDKIIAKYIELGGLFGPELEPFQARLANDETTSATPGNIPRWVQDLMAILEKAGDTDPLMAQAQEEIFETHYWIPAASQAREMGFVTPLAWLVCYDSTIQSGLKGIGIIRRMFPESPPANGGDEKAWVKAYLHKRRKWLLTLPQARDSVYRVDSILALVEEGAWDLKTPVHFKKPRATIS